MERSSPSRPHGQSRQLVRRYRLARSTLGKGPRPTLVRHSVGPLSGLGLEALEEELMGLGEDGGGSPDRADALVWAVTDLLIDGGGLGPRVRVL